MKTYKSKRCRIRKDLVNKYKIPIWNFTESHVISGDGCTFQYKWDKHDNFYIRYGRKWYRAYSIDFEFIN